MERSPVPIPTKPTLRDSEASTWTRGSEMCGERRSFCASLPKCPKNCLLLFLVSKAYAEMAMALEEIQRPRGPSNPRALLCCPPPLSLES